MLPRLREQDVVCVVHLRELVQLPQLALAVKLGILAAVGHQGREIVEEMPLTVGDAAGRENEDPLLVLAHGRRLVLLAAGLVERLVNGGHFDW